MLRWCLAALLVVSTIQFLMMKQQVNRLENSTAVCHSSVSEAHESIDNAHNRITSAHAGIDSVNEKLKSVKTETESGMRVIRGKMIDLEQLDTYIMELENTISALSEKVDVMKDEQDLVSITIKDFEEAVREAEERTLNYNKQLEVIIRELNKNN